MQLRRQKISKRELFVSKLIVKKCKCLTWETCVSKLVKLKRNKDEVWVGAPSRWAIS